MMKEDYLRLRFKIPLKIKILILGDNSLTAGGRRRPAAVTAWVQGLGVLSLQEKEE